MPGAPGRPAPLHGRRPRPTRSRTSTSSPASDAHVRGVGRPAPTAWPGAWPRAGVAPGRPGGAAPGEHAHPLRWIVAYAAIHKAGAVAVPTNTRLSARRARPRSSATPSRRGGHHVAPRSGRRWTRPGPACRRWTASSRRDDRPVGATSSTSDDSDLPGRRWPTTTWPTSCTRRAPPACPRASRCATAARTCIPNGEPPWTGEAWMHGSPLFTFAGICASSTTR